MVNNDWYYNYSEEILDIFGNKVSYNYQINNLFLEISNKLESGKIQNTKKDILNAVQKFVDRKYRYKITHMQ